MCLQPEEARAVAVGRVGRIPSAEPVVVMAGRDELARLEPRAVREHLFVS
jgi:hypothetical protein